MAFFADTSGEPGVDAYFAATTVWCDVDFIEEAGSKLTVFRDLHRYQSDIHFSELGAQKNRFGGPENVALDWLKCLSNDPTFRVRVFVHVVPSAGFDLSYYGKSRKKALNRLLKMNVLFALASLARRPDVVELAGFYDGSAEEFSAEDDVLHYLAREIEWASCSRITQPTVRSGLEVVPVSRRPLSPRGSARAAQDLLALADLVSGAVRHRFSQVAPSRKVKGYLGNIVRDLFADCLNLPEAERALRVCLWQPPRGPRIATLSDWPHVYSAPFDLTELN